ncbi:MAG: hypothetical protein MI921_27375 [Cytophagales bacterium]|nr:hypothetical protein [Cytophagales bacterium]
MNIAITGLLVFFFLIPGLIFRKFYFTEEFSKEYFKQSYFELFFEAFPIASVLYFLWLLLAFLLGHNIDIILLGKLLMGQCQAVEVFQHIQNQSANIFWFHFSLYIFSGFSGYGFKLMVRSKKWDRKCKIFRFKNKWHYLVKGEIYDFPRIISPLRKNIAKDIEAVYVDALVSTDEGTIIYEGVIFDYELSNNGSLEYILLTEVERRYLKDDNYNSLPYKIPGNVLFISNSEIINLNFTYWYFEQWNNGKVQPKMIG